MMLISQNFNRFYNAMLQDVYKQVLAKADVKLVLSYQKFKDMLKYQNLDYPRYNNTGNLVSTKDINSKDLVAHIEFIITWCATFGISPQFVEDEWERILQSAHA